MNGWRIDANHCIPKDKTFRDNHYHHPNFHRKGFVRNMVRRVFPKLGLQRPWDFLLSRKKPHFTLAYHTHDSRNSQKGFPDLVLVHPERATVIFAELKTDTTYPELEQRLWAAAIMCVQDEHPDAIQYFLWRPKHWNAIVQILGGTDPFKAAAA